MKLQLLMNFHPWIPYLLSQYFWVIIISLPFLILLHIQSKQTTKDFFSSSSSLSNNIWNSSKMPYYILHVSDLHLSSSNPESYEIIYSRMKKALDNLRPQAIIISGGITDNSNNNSGLSRYKGMVESDWILFDKLVNELNLRDSDRLIMAAGGTDLYSIKDFDAQNHFANGRIYNKSTYRFNTHPFRPDPSEITIITTNPYDFPTPPLGLLDWAIPSPDYKNELISKLETSSSYYTILVSHHPVLYWYPTFATEQLATLSNILHRSANTRFYLSGHLHPEKPQFYHHGDTLEVVGTSLIQNNEVGLLTFDNHKAAYHQIDLSKTPYGVITSPSPISQISNFDNFYQSDFELRVLVFSEKSTINLYADGAVTSKLQCSIIENGDSNNPVNTHLCSCPLSLNENDHTINISGDWAGSITFTNANTAQGFFETSYIISSDVEWIFLFVFFIVISFIMTLPIKYSNTSEEFDDWINEKSSEYHYIFALFGGFLAVKSRLQKAFKLIRFSLFFATIWILCLPISFFSIDGIVGVLWTGGYIANGINTFTFHGMKLGVHFIIFVLIPIILFTSSVEAPEKLKRSKVFIVDMIIYILFAGGWLYSISILVTIFGFLYALTSPLITLIPLYLHIICIINAVQKKRKGKKKKTDSDNEKLPLYDF